MLLCNDGFSNFSLLVAAALSARSKELKLCQTQLKMNFLRNFFLLIFCSNGIAVKIKRLAVPRLININSGSITLDCDYSINRTAADGLVVKWFFNGTSGLIYQWIPPLMPQVIGLLKGKVDMDYQISDEALKAHRAIKIVKLTTYLSGNYTCVVSTFMEEDKQTKSMLVYSPGRNFHFRQEKKYVFVVTLVCFAEKLYPKPDMVILSRGKPLKHAESYLEMDSWGMYSLTTRALVHDNDVTGPWEEFVCELSLPQADYTESRTTVYYPGLVPTSYSIPVEVERLLEEPLNVNKAMNYHKTSGSMDLTLQFFLFMKFIDWCLISNLE